MRQDEKLRSAFQNYDSNNFYTVFKTAKAKRLDRFEAEY